MKNETNDANDLNTATEDADSPRPSRPAYEDPLPNEPNCILHLISEAAIERGYPARHFLADHRDDEYLPWWLEAMDKCGTCPTCKLLGPNPLRSHMEDLIEAQEANPEGMAALLANQPALPELPTDFAAPRRQSDTLH